MFEKPVLDYMSFDTFCFILLKAAIRRWIQGGHKEIVSNNYQLGSIYLLEAQSMPRKYALTNTSPGWIHAFMFLSQNLTLPSESHNRRLTRPVSVFFYCPVLEPVWVVASASCFYLTWVAASAIFCYCSPSASRFDMLWIHRCFSTCAGWLFEWVWPSC